MCFAAPTAPTRVTNAPISAQGRGQGGASYIWLNTTATTGHTCTYWLEETETDGSTHIYGPTNASFTTAGSTHTIFLPIIVKR